MKTAFITGATGFIGGNLLKKLVETDLFDQINCLVRNPVKANLPESDKIKIFKGDLTDAGSIETAMQGAEAVFHMAAMYEVGISEATVKIMEEINIKGTNNVLSIAQSLKIPRIVYMSTNFALGGTGKKVADETLKHSDNFSCHYERTKYEAHKVAKKYIKDGLPLVIVLPCAVYGENDPSVLGITFEKLIKGKIPAIIKDFEDNKHAYVHVDDVVDGTLLAFEKGNTGESYILGGEVMAFGEMMQCITKIAGSKMPSMRIPLVVARFLAFFDERVSRLMNKKPMMSQEGLKALALNTNFSSNKAQKELGYSPRSNLDGFTQTVNWIKANK